MDISGTARLPLIGDFRTVMFFHPMIPSNNYTVTPNCDTLSLNDTLTVLTLPVFTSSPSPTIHLGALPIRHTPNEIEKKPAKRISHLFRREPDIRSIGLHNVCDAVSILVFNRGR